MGVWQSYQLPVNSLVEGVRDNVLKPSLRMTA